MKTPFSKPNRVLRQTGIALPVVMVFLVVMTLLGIVAIRNVTMEERMAGNSRYQQLAFQAAELAMRSCEGDVMVNSTDPARKFFAPQGLPVKDLKTTPPFDQVLFADTSGNFKKAVNLPAAYVGLMSAVCTVERLKPTAPKQAGDTYRCPYRVTARIQDVSGAARTVMMVQSFIIAPSQSGITCDPAPAA